MIRDGINSDKMQTYFPAHGYHWEGVRAEFGWEGVGIGWEGVGVLRAQLFPNQTLRIKKIFCSIICENLNVIRYHQQNSIQTFMGGIL